MKFKYLVNCKTVVVMTNNSLPTTYPCSQKSISMAFTTTQTLKRVLDKQRMLTVFILMVMKIATTDCLLFIRYLKYVCYRENTDTRKSQPLSLRLT